ncbi:hypothetical protein [Actinacidiphila reveromycinica]|uniref:hypothetical protein n=1 Tax=Actinacidiphila reveromycinica TaxID=659352 RepID=UPI001923F7A2|nr:hypothetical protein [Streptomyces sp. SN-593]
MTTVDDAAYEERHRLLTLSWWQLVCMSAGVYPDVYPGEQAAREAEDDAAQADAA